uniref:Capsid protein n=1 Tax=Picornavirales sp. TaxID=1955153 RepID=A0A514D311_9VIRU|nr:MAG: hypothetical protein H2Rhizo3345_000003 [Picornavirales sp.]
MLANNNDNILGYLNIYPYAPLVSPAGSTIAGYTVYVSFENIRLFGAASPQSGLKSHKKPISNSEVSTKMNGPISGVALAISKGFKEFSNIPLLSSYATPISWIADRVANVASVFGWSKPTSGDSLLKVELLQAANHNTIDGDSDARPMAFLSKPGVVKMDGLSGTEYDEMDFSYIIRKLAYSFSSTWSTSDVVGTEIYSEQVRPSISTLTSGCYIFTPVSFVANMFSLWRGSIHYRLKFVRTEFHSGRIQIAYYPGTSLLTNTGNSAYIHRMIVDIRETPEVDFVIPYISNKPWTSVNDWTGQLKINVVDPLVCPATVSSSVKLILEIAGGEDMEFAVPSSYNLIPTQFVPQSGLDSFKPVNIGNAEVCSNPIVNTSLTIGDKITNFRALLKRYTPIKPTNMTVATGLFLNGSNINIVPDMILATAITPVVPYYRSDMVGLVASCYALWRGGVRIRDNINTGMFTTNTIGSPGTVMTWAGPSTLSGLLSNVAVSVTDNTEIVPNAHLQMQNLRNNTVISVEMPQYTNTYARSVCDATCFQAAFGAAVGVDGSCTQQYLGISLPNSSTTGLTTVQGQSLHNLYRALADDGDFGCFISVPPLRFTTSTGMQSGLT